MDSKIRDKSFRGSKCSGYRTGFGFWDGHKKKFGNYDKINSTF